MKTAAGQLFFFFFSVAQGRFVGFLHRRQFRRGRRTGGNEVATTGGPGSSHVHFVTLTFDRILVAGLPVAFTESRARFCRALNLIYRRMSRRRLCDISSLRRDYLLKNIFYFREIENVAGYISYFDDNYKERTMIKIKVKREGKEE